MATIHVNNSKLQFRLKLILEDLFVTFLDQYLSISYKNIEKIRLANEFILDFEVQMGDVLEELSEKDLDGNEQKEEAENDIFNQNIDTIDLTQDSIPESPSSTVVEFSQKSHTSVSSETFNLSHCQSPSPSEPKKLKVEVKDEKVSSQEAKIEKFENIPKVKPKLELTQNFQYTIYEPKKDVKCQKQELIFPDFDQIQTKSDKILKKLKNLSKTELQNHNPKIPCLKCLNLSKYKDIIEKESNGFLGLEAAVQKWHDTHDLAKGLCVHLKQIRKEKDKAFRKSILNLNTKSNHLKETHKAEFRSAVSKITNEKLKIIRKMRQNQTASQNQNYLTFINDYTQLDDDDMPTFTDLDVILDGKEWWREFKRAAICEIDVGASCSEIERMLKDREVI